MEGGRSASVGAKPIGPRTHAGALRMDRYPSQPLRSRTSLAIHMPTERTTVIVSVNTEQDEEAQAKQIAAHVGEGWRVVQKVPISGGGAGPGGNSEHFMRMQVTLEREIDDEGVIVQPDEETYDSDDESAA